jgi:hypothetical protein
MSDGRIQPGQDIRTAISARAWNRAQEAADIVLSARPSQVAEAAIGRSHILGKTESRWTKGTQQTLTVWAGVPGEEKQTSSVVIAWNKFATIESGRWVMLARVSGSWYLVAAEC